MVGSLKNIGELEQYGREFKQYGKEFEQRNGQLKKH